MAKLAHPVRIQGGNRQRCQVFVLDDIFLKCQSLLYFIGILYSFVFFLFIIMVAAILVF